MGNQQVKVTWLFVIFLHFGVEAMKSRWTDYFAHLQESVTSGMKFMVLKPMGI